MKRVLIGGIAGAALIGTVSYVVVPRHAGAYQSSCWASSFIFPQAVHADPWDRPDILGAELSGYLAVHWKVTGPAAGLRHVPTPDECAYQLVLKLEPAHARRLSADIAAAEAQHQRTFTSTHARVALARRTAAEARFPGRSLPWHPRPTISPELKRYAPDGGRWESWGGCCPYEGHRDRSLYVHADGAVAVVDLSAND